MRSTLNGVRLAVSWTTRPPRAGETDGTDYRFVTDAAFRAARAAGEFAEWVNARGALYGTPWSEIKDALSATSSGATSETPSRVVVLEIDVAGARAVKELFPEAYMVFIAAPSADELRRRLEGRGTDEPDEIDRRIELSKEELAATSEFDRVIVNSDIKQAALELSRIIESRGALRRP